MYKYNYTWHKTHVTNGVRGSSPRYVAVATAERVLPFLTVTGVKPHNASLDMIGYIKGLYGKHVLDLILS